MGLPVGINVDRLRKVDFHVELLLSRTECMAVVIRGGTGKYPGKMGDVVYKTDRYPAHRSHDAEDDARRWINNNNVGRVYVV